MKNILGQIKSMYLELFPQDSYESKSFDSIEKNMNESRFEITEEFILNKKLLYLEYINHLEGNMTDQKLSFLPLNFLRDLENYKFQSQLTTINTTKRINLKSAS